MAAQKTQKTPLNIAAEDMRLLTQDEAKLVEAVSRGVLDQLDEAALADLIQRLRDRRDRARDIANRQRREVRGKADPSGTAPATDHAGTEGKSRILARALDLATEERQRRAGSPADDHAPPTQRDLADRAMALKQAGGAQSAMLEDGSPLHPNDPDADPGKGALSGQERKIAPSGALDHAGDLPSRERSRTRY